MDHSSKILVTGANGHVGFNLVKMLIERGYKNLRASVRDNRDESKTERLRALGVGDIASLDIRDDVAFNSACQNVDVLFHVAATFRFFTGSAEADQAMIDDSVQGVRAAMSAAAENNLDHVVLTSSGVTLPFAKPGEAPPDETRWRSDLSIPYMRAKVEGEKLAWQLAETFGVTLATILPGPILGPHFGKGTQSTDFIDGMMRGSMRMGTVAAVFATIDVRDVAQAHIFAAEQNATGRFIVSADGAPTFVDVLKIMRDIDPKTPKPLMILPKVLYWMLPITDWLNSKVLGTPRTITRTFVNSIGEDQIISNNDKAKRELDWVPEISIEQCLADTMAELSNRQGPAA